MRDLLLRTTGISLSDAKRELMRSRLARRLRALELPSYADYFHYLRQHDPDGDELREMVNCMTTNKTSFFREPYQFDWLTRELLPKLRVRAGHGGGRRIRVWSAGCSTGAEPYTLAMLLRETLEPSWEIAILASDIDTEVLATAEAGEYHAAELEGVDERRLTRHFLRGRGANEGRYRVRPELRGLISFRRINLVEPWSVPAPFDLIFCRNVSIYFNRDTQRKVFTRLAESLGDGGHLFVGHSECLTGMELPLTPLKGNVYRKSGGRSADGCLSIEVGRAASCARPRELVALLSASAAVCVYDAGLAVGGLAHVSWGGGGEVARLIERLQDLGATTERLQAKVIACDNAGLEAVRRELGALGVPLVKERVVDGGRAEIRFFTAEGRVRLSKTASS